jgi:hypothetical protein
MKSEVSALPLSHRAPYDYSEKRKYKSHIMFGMERLILGVISVCNNDIRQTFSYLGYQIGTHCRIQSEMIPKFHNVSLKNFLVTILSTYFPLLNHGSPEMFYRVKIRRFGGGQSMRISSG